jgi:hypothetical protein
LELDLGLFILADIFQFVLVLVAVAYSTWVVLPWGFYDGLKKRHATRQIRLLRRAQVFLFISGVFLTFYVFADLASGVNNLDPFLASTLPALKIALFVAGFGMLIAGLYDSFRVVNFYSGATQAQHGLLHWATLPFLIFNILVILSLGVTYGLGWHYGMKITPFGIAFFISLWFAYVGNMLAIAWLNHIGNLGRELDIKGLIAVMFEILPYILLLVLYLLGSKAGCLFQGGLICPLT